MGKFKLYRLLGKVFSFCILVSFIFTIFLATYPAQITRSDFVSFFAAAEIIKDGKGGELYDFNTQDLYQKEIVSPHSREGFLPFRNPPIFAALFIPFTFFPLVVGYKLYAFFLVVVLLFASYLSTKVYKNLPTFLLPIFFFLYFPVITTIFWGQTPILFLFLFLCLLKLLKGRNYYWVGVLAGLLSLKLQYLAFMPFLLLLVKDRKKLLGGFLISIFWVFMGSLLVSGMFSLAKYPSFLIETEAASFGSRPWQMISIYYLALSFPSLASMGKTAILGINALFYALVLYIFFKQRRKVPLDIAFSAALLFTIAFSLHVQVHDTSLALIPILGALNSGFADKTSRSALGPKIITIILFALPIFLLGTLERGVQGAALVYLILGLYLLKPTSLISVTPSDN